MSCKDSCDCKWRDLAPNICRRRLVLEGTLNTPFTPEDMTAYCNLVTKVLDMTAVTAPICNHDPDYGWCSYMHWKESGMHIYAWDDHDPPFFSIDIYTCKNFDVKEAVSFTKNFFGDNLKDLVWKE